MKIGDKVKVVGIPPDVHDEDDLKTRSLFEKCMGKIFHVEGLEKVEGMDHPLVRLDVGHVVGKNSWEHTIWVEPEFVELTSEEARKSDRP
jgi:hypothetical protein